MSDLSIGCETTLLLTFHWTPTWFQAVHRRSCLQLALPPCGFLEVVRHNVTSMGQDLSNAQMQKLGSFLTSGEFKKWMVCHAQLFNYHTYTYIYLCILVWICQIIIFSSRAYMLHSAVAPSTRDKGTVKTWEHSSVCSMSVQVY